MQTELIKCKLKCYSIKYCWCFELLLEKLRSRNCWMISRSVPQRLWHLFRYLPLAKEVSKMLDFGTETKLRERPGKRTLAWRIYSEEGSLKHGAAQAESNQPFYWNAQEKSSTRLALGLTGNKLAVTSWRKWSISAWTRAVSVTLLSEWYEAVYHEMPAR